MSTTIDSLQIEITQDSQQAVNGLDALTASLGRLKAASRGGVGLTAVSNQLKKLNDAVNTMQNPSAKISQLVSALKPLESIGKSNLNSTINSLKKLPEITKQLAAIDMSAFATQINRVVVALKPLADEMNKVAAGFSAFPSRIQRLITQNERLSTSNKRVGKSFGVMGTGISQLKVKLGVLYFALRRVVRQMADWVMESNDYVENLNLFRVTMRSASDEALDFANKVYDAFGVDPSEWIRFQAVFQNMATGFGIAADKATVMSRNLTQLGYDLATIFNVDYEVAMQKLQSALAGQPRPMREWGFDMSEATLKLAALRHGIEENVETMTQYEKSQIRYLQLMETAKRQGILGNFAREIHTPANAMRILNQQLRLFKRELGNMIIPLLMKILPYLQAVVKLLTDMARTLASFFGFELPVIDYSGLGELPPLLDETEDGFEDATNAAKKFKNLLMGFDEINILPKDTGSSVIGGGAGIGGGGLEIDPSIYDYDFLGDVSNKVNEIVDKIYRKVEPFVNFVRENFDHIKDVVVAVGIGLLNWQIAKGVLSFFQWIQRIGTGGKITLGLTLTLTGITLGAISIGNLVAGSDDVIDAIKAAIGGALALGGSLLVFGTGPLGWTIGVTAVLTMTIVGFIIGTNKQIDALIQEAIGDNGGTLITELSKAFSNLMEEIGSGFDPIIEGGEKLKEHKVNIDRAKQSIETLFNVIQSGASDSAFELEKLIGVMTDLLEETQRLRDQAYDNIIHALSNSFTDVQKTVGVATEEIIKNILLIKNEGDEKLTDAQMTIREYQKAWQKGEISIEEATKGIMEQYDTIYGGRGIVDEVGDSFLGLVTKLDRIDWVTPTERSKALEEIGKSAKKAKEKVELYFDAMEDSIEVFLKDIDDPALRQEMAEALYLFRDEEREAAYTRITDNLELLFVALQTDLVKHIQNVSDEFSQEWDDMEWWEKIGSSKPYYVAQAIDRFRKETMDPVSDSINEILAEFGIKGGEEMQRAVANILDKGFEWDPIYGYVYDFSGELSNVTTEEIEKMEALFGEKAKGMGINIAAGLKGGMNEGVVEKEHLKIFQRIIDWSKNLFGIRSPSVVFQKLGSYLSQGLLKGVNDQINTDKKKWDAWSLLPWDWFSFTNGISSNKSSLFNRGGRMVMNSLLEGMDGFDNKFKTIFQNAVEAARTVFNKFIDWLNSRMHFKWDAITIAGGTVVPAGSVRLFTIPRIPKLFAEGGFPETGQLFIAREAGAELVGNIGGRTAVANNDQIVTAVSEGVYQAVSRAIGQKSSDTSGDVVLNINGSEFARVAIREINRYQRQAGETLLIV